jgi:hypothetical protein
VSYEKALPVIPSAEAIRYSDLEGELPSPQCIPVLISLAIIPLSSLDYLPPSKLAAKAEYCYDSNPLNDDGITATEQLRLIFVWFPVSNL